MPSINNSVKSVKISESFKYRDKKTRASRKKNSLSIIAALAPHTDIYTYVHFFFLGTFLGTLFECGAECGSSGVVLQF
jgi:hypothetical protein